MTMSQIWFSSDFHGFHKNICRGTSTWDKEKPTEPVSGIHGIQSTRNFKTIDDMNQALWKGINDNVKEEDILYFLGDWTFGGIDKIWEFRKHIICKNIHLIYGNHDHHVEGNHILPNCVFTGKSGDPYGDMSFIKDGKPEGIEQRIGAQELFKSTQHYKHITIGKQEIIMSHYAHRVWNRSHHGSIMLYGHSHDSLDRGGEEWGKSMDVGIDSAFRRFGSYRPFSYTEVQAIMTMRSINIVDHHNPTTN